MARRLVRADSFSSVRPADMAAPTIKKGDTVIWPCVSLSDNNGNAFAESCDDVLWVQTLGSQWIIGDENNAFGYNIAGQGEVTELATDEYWPEVTSRTVDERPTEEHQTGGCESLNFGLSYDGLSFGDTGQICDGAVGGYPIIASDGLTIGWGEIYVGTDNYIVGVAPNDVTIVNPGSKVDQQMWFYYK